MSASYAPLLRVNHRLQFDDALRMSTLTTQTLHACLGFPRILASTQPCRGPCSSSPCLRPLVFHRNRHQAAASPENKFGGVALIVVLFPQNLGCLTIKKYFGRFPPLNTSLDEKESVRNGSGEKSLN